MNLFGNGNGNGFLCDLRVLALSVLLSLFLVILVGGLRYLLVFPFGVKFDGPEEVFAFLGFLIVLFVFAVPFFLIVGKRFSKKR